MYEKYSKGNPCIPCYMIFDSEFRKKRPCGPILQSSLMPDFMIPTSWWSPNFLSKANSLEELAHMVGVDSKGLLKSIHNVNKYSKEGKVNDLQR